MNILTLTNYGIAQFQEKALSDEFVEITSFAVGNGNNYTPDPNMTGLVNEQYRCEVEKVEIDPNNPDEIIITSVIPEDTGTFEISEIGIFDSNNSLLAIGMPPVYTKYKDSTKITYICVIVLTCNPQDAVQITFRPQVEISDVEGLTQLFDDHQHEIEDIDLLSTSLDSKADQNHTHLISQIQGLLQRLIKVGDYKFSARQSDHDGWMICDGRILLVSPYYELFSVIQYNFGGEGVHFSLPDCRGRVLAMPGYLAEHDRFIGDKIGEANHTLQQDEVPSHCHSYNKTVFSSSANNSSRMFHSEDYGGFSYEDRNTSYYGGSDSQIANPFNIIQPTLFAGYLFIYSGKN